MNAKKASFAAVPAAVVLWLGLALMGNEGRRYEAYYDSFGIATVCDGITGSAVKFGKVYTDAECDKLRDDYIVAMYAVLGKCVRGEFEFRFLKAFGHFAYNIGEHNFCPSTAARLLNAGQPDLACGQILRWRYGGKNPATGRPWDCSVRELSSQHQCYGLWKRRQWEHAVCTGAI